MHCSECRFVLSLCSLCVGGVFIIYVWEKKNTVCGCERRMNWKPWKNWVSQPTLSDLLTLICQNSGYSEPSHSIWTITKQNCVKTKMCLYKRTTFFFKTKWNNFRDIIKFTVPLGQDPLLINDNRQIKQLSKKNDTQWEPFTNCFLVSLQNTFFCGYLSISWTPAYHNKIKKRSKKYSQKKNNWLLRVTNL